MSTPLYTITEQDIEGYQFRQVDRDQWDDRQSSDGPIRLTPSTPLITVESRIHELLGQVARLEALRNHLLSSEAGKILSKAEELCYVASGYSLKEYDERFGYPTEVFFKLAHHVLNSPVPDPPSEEEAWS